MKLSGATVAAVLGCSVLACTWAQEAAADVSGWTHVGGGALGWKGGPDQDLLATAIMSIDAGVGTTPRAPFIFGGYFRVAPVFDHGVDLAVLLRFATSSFQTSVVGFAFDAGAYHSFWGTESTGFIGQAVLGLPLGLQLAAIGMGGEGEAFGFGGTLGMDFIRLMVDRRHLLEWWPNPTPHENIYASSRPPVLQF